MAQDARIGAMVTVVRSAHCFDGAYVYGGYVRDYLMNMESPRDLDIAMPNLKDAEAFVRVVACTYMVSDQKDRNIYTCADVKMAGMTVTVSPYPAQPTFEPFLLDVAVSPLSHACYTDFTCNLLSFSRNGLHLTYVPEAFRFSPSPVNAVIGFIKGKTFSLAGLPEALSRREAILMAERLCRRASSMVQRGWQMASDPSKSFIVSKFSDLRPDAAKPDASRPDEKEVCSICHEAYSGSDVVVLCRCTHRFHTGCVLTWLGQGRSTCNCPVCRDPGFMLKTAETLNPSRSDHREAAEDNEDDDDDDDDDEDYDEEDDEEEDDEDDDDDDDGDPPRGNFSVTFAI